MLNNDALPTVEKKPRVSRVLEHIIEGDARAPIKRKRAELEVMTTCKICRQRKPDTFYCDDCPTVGEMRPTFHPLVTDQ